MEVVVGFAAVFACVFVDHCVGLDVRGVLRTLEVVVVGSILSDPPGCSGANVVRSYTLPLTTIQQSSAVACLSISETEILESDMFPML